MSILIVLQTGHTSKLPPTPLKINMEPENDGLEDDFPFQTCDF